MNLRHAAFTAGAFVFLATSHSGFAPGEVNCTVASGGAAQVFLTVTP
jgi:hypothetical protein